MAGSPGARAPAGRGRGGLRVLGVLVVAGLLVVAVAALRARLDDAGGVSALPGPLASAAVIALNLVGNLLLADAWRSLVRRAGTPLNLQTAARVWTVGQLARYTLGALQVPGRALAGRRHGVTVTAGALTTLAEVAWGTSLTAVIALATAPAWLGDLPGLSWLALVALLPLALVVAGLVAPQRCLAALARVLDSGPLRRIGGGRLSAGLAGARIDRRLAAGITGRYLAVIAARVGAALLVFTAAGGDVGAEWVRVAGAWALGQTVGQLAVFAPGGLGPREGATAAALAPAIGLEAGLYVAALLRLGEVAAEVAGLGLARFLPHRPVAVAAGARGSTLRP